MWLISKTLVFILLNLEFHLKLGFLNIGVFFWIVGIVMFQVHTGFGKMYVNLKVHIKYYLAWEYVTTFKFSAWFRILEA